MEEQVGRGYERDAHHLFFSGLFVSFGVGLEFWKHGRSVGVPGMATSWEEEFADGFVYEEGGNSVLGYDKSCVSSFSFLLFGRALDTRPDIFLFSYPVTLLLLHGTYL